MLLLRKFQWNSLLVKLALLIFPTTTDPQEKQAQAVAAKKIKKNARKRKGAPFSASLFNRGKNKCVNVPLCKIKVKWPWVAERLVKFFGFAPIWRRRFYGFSADLLPICRKTSASRLGKGLVHGTLGVLGCILIY